MKYLSAALVLVAACAANAQAQQLKLHIEGGRVSLDATNVPARQILAEWARIGGTRVVGAEKITGPALTLKLADVPERQALDIILRNVAGFIAAPRTASSTGASAYDRILVMATSANASGAATNARQAGGGIPNANGNANANANAMNGTQRRVPLRPPNLPPSSADEASEQDEPEPDTADNGLPQPVFTFPGPNGAATPGAPVFNPIQNNNPGNTSGMPSRYEPIGGQTPVITLQPGANGPTIYNFVPNGGAPPSGGFGVVGSPTPGVIQAPAQPVQPGQPTPTTRPPG